MRFHAECFPHAGEVNKSCTIGTYYTEEGKLAEPSPGTTGWTLHKDEMFLKSTSRVHTVKQTSASVQDAPGVKCSDLSRHQIIVHFGDIPPADVSSYYQILFTGIHKS